MQGTAWIEPNNMSAAHGGASPICGGAVVGCCRVRPSVYLRERLQGQSGINPGCSRMKQLNQDSAGEARKDGIRITMKQKSTSGTERAPPRLATHHGKWWMASPG